MELRFLMATMRLRGQRVIWETLDAWDFAVRWNAVGGSFAWMPMATWPHK
jgi:hypothetical protein